jgi:predicted methyltransferase
MLSCDSRHACSECTQAVYAENQSVDEYYKKLDLLIANGTRKVGAIGLLHLGRVARTLNNSSTAGVFMLTELY